MSLRLIFHTFWCFKIYATTGDHVHERVRLEFINVVVSFKENISNAFQTSFFFLSSNETINYLIVIVMIKIYTDLFL